VSKILEIFEIGEGHYIVTEFGELGCLGILGALVLMILCAISIPFTLVAVFLSGFVVYYLYGLFVPIHFLTSPTLPPLVSLPLSLISWFFLVCGLACAIGIPIVMNALEKELTTRMKVVLMAGAPLTFLLFSFITGFIAGLLGTELTSF